MVLEFDLVDIDKCGGIKIILSLDTYVDGLLEHSYIQNGWVHTV